MNEFEKIKDEEFLNYLDRYMSKKELVGIIKRELDVSISGIDKKSCKQILVEALDIFENIFVEKRKNVIEKISKEKKFIEEVL